MLVYTYNTTFFRRSRMCFSPSRYLGNIPSDHPPFKCPRHPFRTTLVLVKYKKGTLYTSGTCRVLESYINMRLYTHARARLHASTQHKHTLSQTRLSLSVSLSPSFSLSLTLSVSLSLSLSHTRTHKHTNTFSHILECIVYYVAGCTSKITWIV